MSYDWQFAGWGSYVFVDVRSELEANCRVSMLCRMSYLDLTPADLQQAKLRLERLNDKPMLDQYRATSIAGNAVWGSVYYSSVPPGPDCAVFSILTDVRSVRLPAIAAVADIYSPICMLVACSILFLLKPILLELGSAMRIDGASVSSTVIDPLCSFAHIYAKSAVYIYVEHDNKIRRFGRRNSNRYRCVRLVCIDSLYLPWLIDNCNQGRNGYRFCSYSGLGERSRVTGGCGSSRI